MEASDALSTEQKNGFLHRGFLRIDEAFPRELADACRAILWKACGCDPERPSTWTRPVIRIGEIPHPFFREAAMTPKLVAAFDDLVGPGRWLPRGSLGTFPIRFPSPEDPGDVGWHVDMSFGSQNEPDFMKWRVNVSSKGRALLMLFLFSDVDVQDAPTRIRVGSHRDIARRLQPHGDDGMSLGELASTGFAESAHREVALATGPAGTVYLCHPFVVHAAQPNGGTTPRFLAQPPLLPATPIDPFRPPAESSLVERSIALALQRS